MELNDNNANNNIGHKNSFSVKNEISSSKNKIKLLFRILGQRGCLTSPLKTDI